MNFMTVHIYRTTFVDEETIFYVKSCFELKLDVPINRDTQEDTCCIFVNE